MKHQNHTSWSATAAIAAALALSATPLAAQDAAAPVTEPSPVQPVDPVPTVAASPAPTVVIPDITAQAASGAGDTEPASEPSATVTKTTTKTTIAPSARKTTHTTVSRTTAPAGVAPLAAVPPPANDVAPLPAETVDTAPVDAAPVPAAEPAPAQTENVTGTLGLILLGLLALAILTVGLMFFRRRNPVISETIEDPLVRRPVAETAIAEPVVATPLAAPTMLRRRDPSPVAGALPSDGAAVDLPATLPEGYEERNALFERMANARPDRANPFTDRRQRMKRARLIMQSLGVTFDREPRIDLSQYPNNWPELRRQYHKAA
uniref:hypothetical protein n=1 Tax=Altererythrobacter segetis TaxID=1104773 RepID=UPI001408BBCB|nr:hypothetical protein [Altererythrobacter segetis]